MSQIIFTQSEEIVDEHPQLHTPSWVEETYLETQYEMGEENIDDEAILEFEADGIEWDGDHEYFFPEAEDFQESVFVRDPEVNDASSPYFILRRFLTEEIIQEIIYQTNLYARQTNIPKWTNLSVQEFWVFFALNILMGVVRKPTLQDYWSTNSLIATYSFGDSMSRDRFLQILRALHFVNLEDPELNQTDRFHKLGSILSRILANFKNFVNPGEFLTLDEELMPYKGSLSIRQYNSKKRGRFGIESFFLMDSQHRYVLDIIPYQGKATTIHDRSWITKYGFGGAIALTFLQKAYFGKNHRLILDNYFQSPTLAKVLVRKRVFVLGTVRRTRKFMPKFNDPVTKKPTTLKSGEIETFSDGDLLLERWGDRREVMMLNTFIEHRMEECQRNPANQRFKPASVLVYNKTMGSVDNMDAIIRPYQTLRKTKKWYRKYAFHLLDICIYNSFVIAGHFNSQITKNGYKAYLLSLVNSMLDENQLERSTKGRRPKCPNAQKSQIESTLSSNSSR
ncbi:piggyBac transposable element-derived protein 4 [Folsomia candida]|uniref:PiggyBac transposable element-derived protein 4 n=1 Tax=Folsomia candida TaxID=158441 RepID=A0A226EJ93_FOLCA|nr:piggyBac transposable element-derived protein 4 [Folsomia candida]OXA56616.1 PiggyBac transposable element-derived protein 4 [Folsomia candida]